MQRKQKRINENKKWYTTIFQVRINGHLGNMIANKQFQTKINITKVKFKNKKAKEI